MNHGKFDYGVEMYAEDSLFGLLPREIRDAVDVYTDSLQDLVSLPVTEEEARWLITGDDVRVSYTVFSEDWECTTHGPMRHSAYDRIVFHVADLAVDIARRKILLSDTTVMLDVRSILLLIERSAGNDIAQHYTREVLQAVTAPCDLLRAVAWI